MVELCDQSCNRCLHYIKQSRPLKVSQKQDVNGSSPIPPPPKTTKIQAGDVQNKNQQTEEILNSILPPR